MPHITHTVPQQHGFSKIRLQSMDTAAGNPGQLSISRPLPQCTATISQRESELVGSICAICDANVAAASNHRQVLPAFDSCRKLSEGSYAELCLVSFPFLKMFDISE